MYKSRTPNPCTCLYFIGVAILLAGLGSSALIYETSRNHPKTVQAYEEGGGSVYPVSPEDSKQYLRDLQLYGGTANVLADELRRWFAGLWHGKSLAFTIACITILVSSGIFYAASHLQPRVKSNAHSEDLAVKRRKVKP